MCTRAGDDGNGGGVRRVRGVWLACHEIVYRMHVCLNGWPFRECALSSPHRISGRIRQNGRADVLLGCRVLLGRCVMMSRLHLQLDAGRRLAII